MVGECWTLFRWLVRSLCWLNSAGQPEQEKTGIIQNEPNKYRCIVRLVSQKYILAGVGVGLISCNCCCACLPNNYQVASLKHLVLPLQVLSVHTSQKVGKSRVG